MIRRAFTLIELLVVIAIIAILAAILFPVFASAKIAAQKSVSISNLKQISTAAVLYSNDWDDMIFSQSWITVPGPTFRTDEFAILLQPYAKNWGVFYDPLRTNKCNRDNFWTGPSSRCKGYGVNTGVFFHTGGTGLFYPIVFPNATTSTLKGRNLSEIEETSNVVMFGTTSDEPMYTTDFKWQDFNGPNSERVPLKRLRYDGMWARSMVDTSTRPVLMAPYRAPGYAYLVMPVSDVHLRQYCLDVNVKDTGGFPSRTCGEWVQWLMLNRVRLAP